MSVHKPGTIRIRLSSFFGAILSRRRPVISEIFVCEKSVNYYLVYMIV